MNTPKDSWIEFFSECRLRPQFELAAGYFDDGILRQAGTLLIRANYSQNADNIYFNAVQNQINTGFL